MNVFRTDRIRNVVLLGNGGAGKTTLAEAMAYLAGMTNRLGRVEDGNTDSDFDEDLNHFDPGSVAGCESEYSGYSRIF